MGGKAPITILTDQCKAMTKAIRLVMRATYHLWCKWHVMKKIRECLGPLYTKNKKFRDEFWLVVNGMLTEDEFEVAWADIVKKYHLEENGFMKRIYSSKKKWAKPWSRDKFCARMSSTQRSESANFMLKRFVPRNSSMNQFVSQYNKLLCERDREEDAAEDKTKQLKMVHSRLWPIERHALTIYTKAAFELFRAEVDKASNYVIGGNQGDMYTVSHSNAAIRAQWARVHFKVEAIDGGLKWMIKCMHAGERKDGGISCLWSSQ
ncbi:protein FAR1-RELATED SEQUENCE 5-like [Sorghum bicolor]|nr:protein FAR1-RELATED SEQUENCE 5-like [Sorghum bicolor]|eukprot:XP_021313902.1 protein FAR1-RELATED SEQUENCE 5-like [Sorghum bicolor]